MDKAIEEGKSLREYIEFKISDEDLLIYGKYNNAALHEFPGYSILLLRVYRKPNQ